jgi:hypothetical protein
VFRTEHLVRPSVDRQATGGLVVGIAGLILTTRRRGSIAQEPSASLLPHLTRFCPLPNFRMPALERADIQLLASGYREYRG